jgi:signal transduction histidine kinase
VVGAVVVEETTNSIQTLQRDAMADLFNRSIAVFLLVTLFLLFFASRLTIRLTRLRDETELAIDTYGRVVGDIEASRANDEIGDLSRSYAAMLRRLKEYNAYLETMGGKLSHEIRTPLAVVSSSFENLLAAADDDERERYIARAQEGLARLQNLVRRLGEAARLEQSIAGVELECFDLAELVRTIGDGYAQAYPQHKFRLDCPAGPIWIDGSPDLIAQLLDKLVENALDFCDPGTAVSMRLHTYGKEVLLEVENQGARLPETAALQLFDSMVSVRGGNRSDRPHLGLGLYIVRLIAEHHGASVSAENVGGSRAVVFRVVFPLRDPVSDAN